LRPISGTKAEAQTPLLQKTLQITEIPAELMLAREVHTSVSTRADEAPQKCIGGFEMIRNRYFGILIAIVFALAAVGHAESGQLKTGKAGHITIRQEVRVGNAVLQPGDYEVRYRNSATGHFMEFTQVVDNPYGPSQTLSPVDWVVVADVPCTMKSLNQSVTKTAITLSEAAVPQILSLEVRGENVVHTFLLGPDASAPQNRVEPGFGG
jgi:hypothetical protein